MFRVIYNEPQQTTFLRQMIGCPVIDVWRDQYVRYCWLNRLEHLKRMDNCRVSKQPFHYKRKGKDYVLNRSVLSLVDRNRKQETGILAKHQDQMMFHNE